MAYKFGGSEYDTIKITKDGLCTEDLTSLEGGSITIINNSEIKFDASEIFYVVDDFVIVLENEIEFLQEDKDEASEKYKGFFLEHRPEIGSNNTINYENSIKYRKILIVNEYEDNSEKEFKSEPIFLEIIRYNENGEPEEAPDIFKNKFIGWDKWSHKFCFKKDYFDENEVTKELKITLYNRFGHNSPFILNYKVEDDNRDIKFKLLSANIDNRGKISYMLDNIANEKSQIVLAAAKNPC